LTIDGGFSYGTGAVVGDYGGDIYNAGTLTLDNCTSNGGFAEIAGGGIYNSGTLTLENTMVVDNRAGQDLMNIGMGGGIFNHGTMTLIDTTITRNTATADSGVSDGGGIYNDGTATISNSTMNYNSIGAAGGEGFSHGGGIYNAGVISVAGTTLNGNFTFGAVSAYGGGIYNTGTLALADSTVTGGDASSVYGPAYGGGIYNTASLMVEATTIDDNSAGSPGCCGIRGGIDNAGTVSLVNTTITGNNAGVGGQGIYNSGTLYLADSTVDGNRDFLIRGGEAITNASTQNHAIIAIGSILSSSGVPSVSGGSGGAFQSLGHNLFSDKPDFPVDSTDQINTNAMLGPLAGNGGPTLTQALLPGSPAINAGVAVPGVTTDQRGVYRPQGAAPDIGAFEVQLPPVVFSVERLGVHLQPTSLVVTFIQPMDAGSIEDLANYRLVSADPEHRSGTRRDPAIRIRSVRYDAASLTATILPIPRLPLGILFSSRSWASQRPGLRTRRAFFWTVPERARREATT
jgi:hypothetical protein